MLDTDTIGTKWTSFTEKFQLNCRTFPDFPTKHGCTSWLSKAVPILQMGDKPVRLKWTKRMFLIQEHTSGRSRARTKGKKDRQRKRRREQRQGALWNATDLYLKKELRRPIQWKPILVSLIGVACVIARQALRPNNVYLRSRLQQTF